MAAIQPFVFLKPFKDTEKIRKKLLDNSRVLCSSQEYQMQIAIDIYTFTRKEEHCPSLTNSQMPHGNFDQQPDATRKDYDVAIPALRERYLNDQRIPLLSPFDDSAASGEARNIILIELHIYVLKRVCILEFRVLLVLLLLDSNKERRETRRCECKCKNK